MNSFGPQWLGQWIAPNDPDFINGNPISPDVRDRPAQMALFRHFFDCDAVPASVPARLSADSRYRLWINGRIVGRGPIRAQPRRMAYDSYDIAPYLQQGRNTIAAEVLYYGRANSMWMPAVGNATLGKRPVFVFEAVCDDLTIGSNADWEAKLCPAFADDAFDRNASMVGGGVPAQSHNAMMRDTDWMQSGDWPNAEPIVPIYMGGPGRATPPSDPYGPLTGHKLAPMSNAIVRSVSQATDQISGPINRNLAPPAARVEHSCLNGSKGRGHYRTTIDFGRMVAGHVWFDITAPKGTEIDISYVELPITVPAHFGAHGGTRYIARGAADRFETFDRQGFRYAILISDNEIDIHEFNVIETLYPWAGGSHFECDDAELTGLYTAARRTVALNSWDCFIDCPSREQRAWTGDSVVHLMTHLVANDDWELCWRNLELTASPRYDGLLPMSAAGDVEYGGGFSIPDWSLHWIHGLYSMYQYSGDRDRIRPLLNIAEGVLRWFTHSLNDDGLLADVPEWNLIDWSSIYSGGISAPVNGLWARGLREFSEMAEWMGDAGRSDWARALYDGVTKQFDRFWDDKRGLYTDRADSPAANQISTAIAIVAGLCPPDRIQTAAKAMTTNMVERSWLFGPEPADAPGSRFRSVITSNFTPDWDVETEIVSAQPFMAYLVHDALFVAGDVDGIRSSLRRWNRFLTDGFDTFGEIWNGGSKAHGWSSTPARDLIAYVLGLRPAEPGFGTAVIAPRLSATDSGSASAPTPFGPISMEWSGGEISIMSPVPIKIDGQKTVHPAGQITVQIQ